MSETVERFSNRVANYVKYRPGYPSEVLEFFRSELGLTPGTTIADIGSGTGLSSRLFVENGNTVFGVEPNAAMRAAAEEYLKGFSNFVSVDGTAEATTLPDGSVDIVMAAQAFHWFDRGRAREEFKRILRPGGYIALVWNERQLDSTPFLRDYEKLLLKYGRDYEKVRHDAIDEAVLREFFGQEFKRQTFENVQVLDLDGIRGRMLSSSYMPDESDPAAAPLLDELKTVFAKHQENGKIEVFYDTNIFYSQV